MHAERVTAREPVVGDVCKSSHGDVPAFTAMKRGSGSAEARGARAGMTLASACHGAA
jgi:hypothetical protein